MNLQIQREFDKPLTEIGARMLGAYLGCSQELQQSAREMIEIINSPGADEDDRAMALHTLAQIFFPERDDCSVSIEHLDACSIENQPDGAATHESLDREETSFSERLATVMEAKGITQTELAKRTKLSQPAISLMLSRSCRPQQRTVRRLAEALGVQPRELWSELDARDWCNARGVDQPVDDSRRPPAQK